MTDPLSNPGVSIAREMDRRRGERVTITRDPLDIYQEGKDGASAPAAPAAKDCRITTEADGTKWAETIPSPPAEAARMSFREHAIAAAVREPGLIEQNRRLSIVTGWFYDEWKKAKAEARRARRDAAALRAEMEEIELGQYPCNAADGCGAQAIAARALGKYPNGPTPERPMTVSEVERMNAAKDEIAARALGKAGEAK
jgi:hypothetical protein